MEEVNEWSTARFLPTRISPGSRLDSALGYDVLQSALILMLLLFSGSPLQQEPRLATEIMLDYIYIAETIEVKWKKRINT